MTYISCCCLKGGIEIPGKRITKNEGQKLKLDVCNVFCGECGNPLATSDDIRAGLCGTCRIADGELEDMRQGKGLGKQVICQEPKVVKIGDIIMVIDPLTNSFAGVSKR